jgi:glycosyltransferase involved in cell wall biosynthesis
MPLVDVILPTTRRPHTVRFSVASVLRQTAADFTLHVVGDGCDDETERTVRDLADPRVVFRRFPKGRGFGYANRNTVLRETTAPFVAYMTDDDLLFPDHLERGLRALEGGRELVSFRAAEVRYPDKLIPNFFAFDWRLGAFSRFLTRWFIASASMVHRRTLFDRVGYWDEELLRFGDREFFQRACRANEAASLLSDTTLLRFFSNQWDPYYATCAAPPQARYLELLGRPGWVAEIRRRAGESHRSPGERVVQAGDFLSFAFRSGTKFLRHLAGRAFS